MAQQPGIPKGTRDFSPQEIAGRDYIIQTIKKHFRLFGFQPIETPSFENTETLLGKYGEEGDRLIFKILNSGDYLSKVKEELYHKKDSVLLSPEISEKALRYDLTVPFARYVVMHRNEINFPFKRYQIQPVWRADRPQKGRYREFWQCDADVVGSGSLWQEVELIQLYDAVFSDLQLRGVTIKLNHRKLLSGIAGIIGAGEQLTDFTVALDKLDKIGEEGVIREMQSKGITDRAIEKLKPLFGFTGDNREKLRQLKTLLAASETGNRGVEELDTIIRAVETLGLNSATLSLDVTLARGLHYYTGTIVEVVPPPDIQLGSIGGGGRYDDLTGIFGLKGVSGVGISFGLDRIYMALEALQLFPPQIEETATVLFVNFGEKEALQSLAIIKKLRQAGVASCLYPDTAKMKKQMQYADKQHIPFVALIGAEEIARRTFVLKNMITGAQETHPVKAAVEVIASKKAGE